MRMKMVIIISSVSILLLPFCILAESPEYQEQYLQGHNAARASVGVPPLTWNENLEKKAHEFLKKHIIDHLEEKPRPSESHKYGHNLAWHEGPEKFTGRVATARWVAEKAHYDHVSNSCIGGDCECYVQVVWKDTTEIGCAEMKWKKDFIFFACLYSPPGNIHAHRPY
ncbi:pathogenesis-related protein PR-1 type-like [Arachis stenosperma]|uniref:pathogenesis-related protein PR-1 type-like n=1 Tax=Arachis stenosperma TaxID=217475 RepID=UPI0025AC4A98|nr:pathogenesis-related protein PR-1 type-like [Arachis stenosperma]